MALIGNYGDLQNALAEWLGRAGDPTLATRTDQFVYNFESDFILDPDMRTIEMEEVDTAVLSSASIPLPAGFIEMIRLKSLAVNDGADQDLDYASPAYASKLDISAQQSFAGVGIAKYFTVLAGNIIVTPQIYAPIGGTLELAYYQFTRLSVAPLGVNWLLQKYPNIYLYGSLIQAAAYVDDDATVAKWSAELTKAMTKLGASDRKRKVSGGSVAMRPSQAFAR